MTTPTIPFNALGRQHDGPLHARIAAATDRVIRSGWFVLGQEVVAFEREFARYCGVDEAIGVANGSDALCLAIAALDLPSGSAIAVAPNAAMYATLAILENDCVPYFVDVDPATGSLDPDRLAAVPHDVRAVIVTHLYGRVAAIDAICGFAAARHIDVVEDCAQAHGARSNGRCVGSFGRVGCFSFYPTKNLGALGDGGALVTSDAAIAARLRQLRQYGWSAKYDVAIARGRNSRLDELQAAILREKLRELDTWNERRHEIAARYTRGIAHARILTPDIGGENDVAHLYVVRCEQRDSLRAHLASRGIGTDVHYPIPDHRQRLFEDKYRDVDLPAAEALARTVLSLPCFPELRDDEVDCVIDACNEWNP